MGLFHFQEDNLVFGNDAKLNELKPREVDIDLSKMDYSVKDEGTYKPLTWLYCADNDDDESRCIGYLDKHLNDNELPQEIKQYFAKCIIRDDIEEKLNIKNMNIETIKENLKAKKTNTKKGHIYTFKKVDGKITIKFN